MLTRVNDDIDGEYQLCIKISDAVYTDEAGIKSIKTKLFFSNEYYNCKLNQSNNLFSEQCRWEKDPIHPESTKG